MMAARKKLGLALGGGGARALANIGVLQVLQKAQVEISLIAGTSMGGYVGALFAAGIPIERIAALARATGPGPVEFIRHLFDLTVSPRGFLRGERIRQAFAEALGNRHTTFSQLNLPLALMAADLRSGREVVLDSGSLVDALRATCSVPGVFLPVEHGDTTLVDGGILNNVPADVARDMGAEVVLAVNVLPDFTRNRPGLEPEVRGLRQMGIPAAIREQIHVQMIMLSSITERKLAESKPDILLYPEISERVGLFAGYNLADQTIEAGARAAEAQLDRLLELLEPAQAAVK